MKISLDGGLTWLNGSEIGEVRILYEKLALNDSKTGDGILSVVATHDGLMMDVYSCIGEIQGTSAEMAQNIADRLLKEAS